MNVTNDTTGQTLTIIDGDEAYYEQVQRLCDERFGTGYIDHDTYDRWLKQPQLLKLALMDGDYAGFAVMLPASTEEVMRHMDMPREDVLAIAGDKPALIYQSAAVETKYQRRGVMKAMADAGIAEARALGYGSLFGSAWVYNGIIPIEGVFRTFGFTRLYERHMLWHNDENYRCVVCKGRCVCDAVIYYKKL